MIEYTYNRNQLTQELWKNSVGTVVDTLSYNYNDDGQMLSATKGGVGYSFTYDNLARLKTQTDWAGIVQTFGYNNADDKTQVTYSIGGTVTTGFDAAHRITSRTGSAGSYGTNGVREEYSYSDRDQRIESRRYADAAGTTLIGKTETSYDDGGRKTSDTIKDGSGIVQVAYTNTFNAANRITSEVRNSNTKNFTYDANSQVTSDGSNSYTYDKNGNRTMAGYNVTTSNRIQNDGTWTYIYDDEGNTTSKTRTSDNRYWVYSYDNRNQLTQAIEYLNVGGPILQTVSFTNDVFGNVIAKNASGTITKYVYQISNSGTGYTKSVHELWAELDASNNITTRYLNGIFEGEIITRTDSTGTAWLLEDRLGSIREITDNAGAIIKAVGYDGFGKIVSIVGTGNLGNVQFTGFYWHAELNMYVAHWRWYNPDTATWQTEDPIGFNAGDMNDRRYVGNNGLNSTDRNGLEVPGYHHFYSLFLGGHDEQMLFPLSKEEHTAAHDVLRKHGVGRKEGVSYDQARANWAAKNATQQRAIIAEAMKAANIPQPLIDKHIDSILHGASPGTNNTHTRKTPKQTQLISKSALDQCRKAAALAAKTGATITTLGLTFFYDKTVQAGEESGLKLTERIGLGEKLQLATDENLIPSTNFKMEFRGKTVSIELVPDPADDKGGHFITAFYYEQINQGTWGDIKVFFTFGARGQPETIRHDIIRRSDNFKTYQFTYPSK